MFKSHTRSSPRSNYIDAKPTKNKNKTELPSILLPLSEKDPGISLIERKKFQPFKPANVDYFHERQYSEQPRVGLLAPKIEKPIDIIHESMARVKIIRTKTPRSRRQATINIY